MDDLTKSYCRWAEIYFFGSNDPGWDDGCNINLVRNHILYYRSGLEKDADGRLFYDFPESYYLPIPPKAPHLWMAKKRQKKTFCCREDELDYSREWATDFNDTADKLKHGLQAAE